jgi:uncharacterized protein (DUF1697 family)
MTVYVALLRAINVGGTGKLPMKDLVALCVGLGFAQVRTYIQSGNVLFESSLAEQAVRRRLETALSKRMGKRIDVCVRTAAELRAVLKNNPFPRVAPAKIGVHFQSERVKKELLGGVVTPGGEEVRLGKREIYVHFPNGMGRSKLKLQANVGTMRNINTVAKLVALAGSPGT